MKNIELFNNSSNMQWMKKGDRFQVDKFLPKDRLDTALK